MQVKLRAESVVYVDYVHAGLSPQSFATWIAFACGLLLIAVGFLLATTGQPVAMHYFGKTSGQVIDQGIHMVLFAIILGVITDISWSVGKEPKFLPMQK